MTVVDISLRLGNFDFAILQECCSDSYNLFSSYEALFLGLRIIEKNKDSVHSSESLRNPPK